MRTDTAAEPPVAGSTPAKSFSSILTDWEWSGPGSDGKREASARLFSCWLRDGSELDLTDLALKSMPDCFNQLPLLKKLYLDGDQYAALKGLRPPPPSCEVFVDGQPAQALAADHPPARKDAASTQREGSGSPDTARHRVRFAKAEATSPPRPKPAAPPAPAPEPTGKAASVAVPDSRDAEISVLKKTLQERDAEVRQLKLNLLQMEGAMRQRELEFYQKTEAAALKPEPPRQGGMFAKHRDLVFHNLKGKEARNYLHERYTWKEQLTETGRQVGKGIWRALGNKKKVPPPPPKPQTRRKPDTSPAPETRSGPNGTVNRAGEMNVFDAESLILRDVKSHLDNPAGPFRKIEVSAAGNNCWLRAAWMSVMLQYRDKPQELAERTRGLSTDVSVIRDGLVGLIPDGVRHLDNHVRNGTGTFAWSEDLDNALKNFTYDIVSTHMRKEVEMRKDLTNAEKDARSRELEAKLSDAIHSNEFGDDFYIDVLMRKLGAHSVIYHHPPGREQQWEIQARSNRDGDLFRFAEVRHESALPGAQTKRFLDRIRDVPVLSHQGAHFNVYLPRE